jgi:FlaA1/EpsC-like NDP-sugar epimerase
MYKNFNLDNFISQKVTRRKESLLKKDLVKYNTQLDNKIFNKNVLVIGGAGSIGSSYIKAILKFKVKKLVVVDLNENGLTELVRDLRSSSSHIMPKDFITYPIDFASLVFEKIFKNHGPFEIVANFAAHKHVRSEKDIFSIEAMIENNLIKAKKLLEILVEYPPEHFFCVSTDKAANPVNIMGASKKLMEELILSYSKLIPIKTARFANVAFSNGSLLLGFINRLFKKQPWSCPTVIKRFFVSPEEAGQLCLIACVMGETGDIFFPKLDEEKDMIPFDQIAIDLLNHLKLEPDFCNSEKEAISKSLLLNKNSKKYPVFFFKSDTSGEKSFEEFYTDDEELDLKSFNELGVIKNTFSNIAPDFNLVINDITNLFLIEKFNKKDLVSLLQKHLPNFSHIETGKHLDQKM